MKRIVLQGLYIGGGIIFYAIAYGFVIVLALGAGFLSPILVLYGLIRSFGYPRWRCSDFALLPTVTREWRVKFLYWEI